MISLLVYDQDQNEMRKLIEHARDAVAHLSDDQLKVDGFSSPSDMKEYISGKDLLDMAFLDVVRKDGLAVAIKLRSSNKETEFLLLADSSVSPMQYINPSVRASSLLLRPFTKQQADEVIYGFFRAYYRSHEFSEDSDILLLETRSGRLTIPYSKIYYLEVREKRVYVRLKNIEYFKYGTLTQIMEELSDRFIRCHRSFVINEAFIREVRLQEGVVVLEDGIEIPLSRSYKKPMREKLDELRKR